MEGIEDNINVSVNMSASSNNVSTSSVNNASGVNNVRDYSKNDNNSDNMSGKNNDSVSNESDNWTTDKNALQSKNIWITLTEIWKNKYADLSILKKSSASDIFPIESCNFSLYKGEPDPINEKYWDRFILCKLTTKTWEILDPDRITLIKEAQDKQDSGVLAE